MLRHRNIDRICCLVLAAVLLLTCGYMGAGAAGWIASQRVIGYENRLFDTARVHTLDIVMEDWEGFLATCTDEEYVPCHVVIDGESYKNVAIRAKGNTSLSSVKQYGNNRYSFKIEFDHYQPGGSYHGLDKLSLNNLIQDNTYMKDYFAYTLMRKGGAAAPLCSFVQINVNGEPWGLYLAVEGVEDSFLRRNYGSDAGELYKPDSMSFGGGRGNGMGFDMEEFRQRMTQEGADQTDPTSDDETSMPQNGATIPQGMMPQEGGGNRPDWGGFGGSGEETITDDTANASDNATTQPDPPDATSRPDFEGNRGGMGSSDVLLQYTDDDPASYSNIFDNAKTDVNQADQQRLIQSLKALSEGDASVVDTDAVIRYLVVHSFLCNDDSYTGSMVHNYYLYEKDGVLSMLPWDYNLAFGGFGMGGGFGASGATGTVNQPIDSPVTGGDLSTRPILSWIFDSEETIAAYHTAYEQFISEAFESGWFTEEIDRVSALIAPYVENDPTAFCTYEEFQTGVSTLKAFCLLRAQSVAGQLDGNIPSTSEGQRNTDALVDASHLNLSDMGSMGNIHGGSRVGEGGFGGGREHTKSSQGFGDWPNSSAGAGSGQPPQEAQTGGFPGRMTGEGAATAASGPESAGEDASQDAGMPVLEPAAPSTVDSFIPLASEDPSAPQEQGSLAARPIEAAPSSATTGQSRALLGLCVVVLLAALLLVSRYKSNL